MFPPRGRRRFAALLTAPILAIALGFPALADCTAPASGPPLCLSGVVTAPGFQMALVEQPGKAGLTRLRQNDVIADWTVSEIGPRFVEFTDGDQSYRMALTNAGATTEPVTQTAGIRPGAPEAAPEEPGPGDMNQ